MILAQEANKSLAQALRYGVGAASAGGGGVFGVLAGCGGACPIGGAALGTGVAISIAAPLAVIVLGTTGLPVLEREALRKAKNSYDGKSDLYIDYHRIFESIRKFGFKEVLDDFSFHR